MSSKRKSYTKKMTFPQISLDKALERLRLLSPEKRIYTNPELAKIFKNKSHTSGSYKEKTTALREFGLFTRTSPDIEISNLGKKILINRNVSLDDLQRAFFSCNMFKETYLHFLTEKNITPDKLANEAVKSYTVTPLMMDNFAHIFLKSAEHAGLAEKLVDGYTLLDSEYAHTLTTPRTSSFDTQTKKVPTTTTKRIYVP